MGCSAAHNCTFLSPKEIKGTDTGITVGKIAGVVNDSLGDRMLCKESTSMQFTSRIIATASDNQNYLEYKQHNEGSTMRLF